MCTTLAPMFLTEISPLKFRGIFGTCHQFGVVIGMLVAWVVGLPELGIGNSGGAFNSYSFVLGLPLLFGALQLIILPFCTDSPAYLASKSRMEEAAKSYKFYGGVMPAEGIATDADGSGQLKFTDTLFYKPLLVAGMMMLSQQLCGINAIFYYSTGIFQSAGVENGPLSTVYVGITNVVFTFIR